MMRMNAELIEGDVARCGWRHAVDVGSHEEVKLEWLGTGSNCRPHDLQSRARTN